MLFFDGALGFLLFALWVFCLFDVITTDESLCRNLQKTWWILIVLLLFDVGSVLWLVAGRPWPQSANGPGLPYRGNTGHRHDAAYPEYDRPGRFAATSPEDDEKFLRQVRERAEEQRRLYREKQRREQENGEA
jgi:phospholipase D-like protein